MCPIDPTTGILAAVSLSVPRHLPIVTHICQSQEIQNRKDTNLCPLVSLSRAEKCRIPLWILLSSSEAPASASDSFSCEMQEGTPQFKFILQTRSLS